MRLLAEHDVSALPVGDNDDNVVGVISEADLVHREEIGTEKHRSWWLEAMTPASTLAGEFAKSHGRRVSEVMSTDVGRHAAGRNRHDLGAVPDRGCFGGGGRAARGKAMLAPVRRGSIVLRASKVRLATTYEVTLNQAPNQPLTCSM